jgi:hypothetical protein
VEFGVPAYNEGAGVVRTLESIRVAADACGLAPAIRLSDSSDTRQTADAATAWAGNHDDVRFDLDYSEERRSLKAANNVLLDKATADIIVVSVGDAVVPPRSLLLLLSALTVEPRPVVAFGCSYPDPSARSLRFRASAWQIRVVQRLAASLPPDAPRADGVLWAAGRGFYAGYRFPTGAGSLHDDEELKRHLVRQRLRIGNVAGAIAYKIPAGSFDDFARQTDRWFHVAEGTVQRDPRQLRAAAAMAVRDPLGAALYVFARARLLVRRRRQPLAHSEQWDVTYSAKRDG